MSWVAYQLYVRPGRMTYTNAMNMMREQTPITNMNTQLQTVCNTARTANVVVYTIAFEATTTGQTQLMPRPQAKTAWRDRGAAHAEECR